MATVWRQLVERFMREVRRPRNCFVRQMLRSCIVLWTTQSTVIKAFRYCGAVPCRISYIKVHSLNCTRLDTGSQWSCFRRCGACARGEVRHREVVCWLWIMGNNNNRFAAIKNYVGPTYCRAEMYAGPSHAAPWWVTVSKLMPTGQTVGRTPDRYITLSACQSQRNNKTLLQSLTLRARHTHLRFVHAGCLALRCKQSLQLIRSPSVLAYCLYLIIWYIHYPCAISENCCDYNVLLHY